MQTCDDSAVLRAAVVTPPRRVVRVAFVGAPDRLAACTHDAAGGGVVPVRVGVSSDDTVEALRARIGAAAPEVIVVLGPDHPAAAFAGLDAVTLGYLADRLPPGADALEAFDRIVAASERRAAEAESRGAEVWRVLPIPVADRVYRPARRPAGAARVLELGAGRPPEPLGDAEVAVNRDRDASTARDHAILTCMAAGLLVLSPRVASMAWLEPDIDFVETASEGGLAEALDVLRRDPSAFHRQRLGGRLKVEWMRASGVWSRIVADLRRDVAAFGRRG